MNIFKSIACFGAILSNICVSAMESNSEKMSDVSFSQGSVILDGAASPMKSHLLAPPPAPPSGSCSPLCAPSAEGNFSLGISQYWCFPAINDSECSSSSDGDDGMDLLVLPTYSGRGTCYRRNSDACVFSPSIGETDSERSTSSSKSPQTDSNSSDSLFSNSPIERSKSASSLDS